MPLFPAANQLGQL
uniref:Uncharacterized protein n=1 Tax=Anguilla anguilla TaxID=7936 RepID=A0A0E9RF50_ANGAN